MTFYRHRVIGPGSAGDVWVSTMHSDSTVGIDAVHNAWQALWINFWTDTYKALVTPQVQITQLVTDQLDPLTGANVAQKTTAVNYVGTGAGTTVSPRNCLLLSFITTLPTRRGRGRMYLPSPDSSHYANTGSFVTGLGLAVAEGWQSQIDSQFGADPAQTIYHRDTHTGTPVIGVKVGNVPATMRSRTNKVQNAYAQVNY